MKYKAIIIQSIVMTLPVALSSIELQRVLTIQQVLQLSNLRTTDWLLKQGVT